MALPASTLSQVCRSIADFLTGQLRGSQNNIQVRIGSPASAAPGQGDNEHRVNLFFYRMESNGFGPSAAPDETWLLRLFCLVTAFGVDEDQVSAGDNDLRLLGGVLAAFHERPILDPVAVNGTIVRTHVVFQPLRTEEVNQLWSTQGDVPYRPSVAYEMALTPILPRHPRIGGPMVGAVGLEVRADATGRYGPFGGEVAAPEVVARTVETRAEAWAPSLCFVVDRACAESVSFAVNAAELAAFRPRVWVAGPVGAQVQLRWEIWDSHDGWRPGGQAIDATATGERLDPAAATDAALTEIALPFADHAGQAVLYAERSYSRAADGVAITVRSNLLLVSLY